MNYFNTLWIYNANSLVGEIITALVPTILECILSLFNNGIMNAAVLPLPVLLLTTTSLPSKI